MRQIVLLLAVLKSISAFLDFDDYVSRFGKEYSAEELILRKGYYEANILIMQGLQEAGDFVVEENEFTDWSSSQLADLKGLKTRNGGNDDEGNIVASSDRKVGNPTSFDWRDRDGVSSVKNQGRCGSCWAFAAAAYGQSKMLIDDRYDSIDLAEQEILECTKDSDCNGGYLEYAFDTLLDEIAFEFLYPYSPSTSYSGICNAQGVQIGQQAKNYYDLSDSKLIDLVVERPIAISVSAENWEYYGSGVFRCDLTDPINHAVLLVGYTSDYWIIKNSWGEDWGMDGYIYVSRNPLYNCRIGNSAHTTFEWKLTATLSLAFLLLVLWPY